MLNDIRDKNQYFSKHDIATYLNEYADQIASSLKKINRLSLEHALSILNKTHVAGGRIFVGGNGGSASIADHLTCDFVKGTYTPKKGCLKVHSLNAHMALFTALANDVGYDKTFSEQLLMYEIGSRDTVILISSSGNSSNVIEAAKVARDHHAEIIGLTGFSGGNLKGLAHACLHVEYDNYGLVEDCHQALMHVLAQFRYLGER